MHADTFWKKFWLLILLLLLLYVASVAFILYLQPDSDAMRADAVGAFFDPTRDPFEKPPQEAVAASDYLYRDSLPLGASDWSWGSRISWRSSERRYEGFYAIRAIFLEPESGMHLHHDSIALAPYASLSLAIRPSTLGDFYLELYDTEGHSMGRQSLQWYAPGGALALDVWNILVIPLENLTAPRAPAQQSIIGFAIIAEEPGVAFIDAVLLQKSAVSYPRWEE